MNLTLKRNFIMIGRIFKAGLLNFIRNAWLAIAAMAVMVITLTIILFSFIANQTFGNTITQITDKIDVSVFLKDSVTVKQKDHLLAQLKDMPEVKHVDYVSKEQALETYVQQNSSNPDLVAAISITDNPLPATIKIKPTDPNQLNQIRQFLQQPDIKKLQSDTTNYSGDRKEAIDKITKAANFLREAGIAGILMFALISMLIIFNTIRMAIFNRRDELTIMRLLGATTTYIRGPFVVETMLYGVVAAVISVFLVNSLFIVWANAFDASSLGLLNIGYANDYFAGHFWLIIGAQLALGIIIGSVSSLVATRRYLKFKTTK